VEVIEVKKSLNETQQDLSFEASLKKKKEQEAELWKLKMIEAEEEKRKSLMI
jgi:hypothetical protein